MNYKFRMYDPRIGRFFAVDPLAAKYPHNSPYAFSENQVIHAVELEGLEKVEAYVKMVVAWTETKIEVVDGQELERKVHTTLNLNVFVSYDYNDGNNTVNFVISGEGFGSIKGSYNLDTETPDYEFTTEMLGAAFENKFNEESLFKIPDWLASSQIESAVDDYSPKSLEEAQNMSSEDAEYNQLVRFTLNSISKLVDQGKISVGYHGYDGSETGGVNEQGESYTREFTHKYRLSGSGGISGDDGFNAAFDVRLDYTDEKCTSCD